MSFYILYVLILLILAFLIGCIIGWFLKRAMTSDDVQTSHTVIEDASASSLTNELEPVEEKAASSVEAGTDVPAGETEKPATLSAPVGGKADDLKRIKGIGKVIEGKLHGLGIYHFSQIAAWTEKEVEWVNGYLSFSGRIGRENWIEQAKLLASGAETEFSKRVDKGEVESSK